MNIWYSLICLTMGFFHVMASLFLNVTVLDLSKFQKIKTEKTPVMTECCLSCERMPLCMAVGWISKSETCDIFVQRSTTETQREPILCEEYWVKDEQIGFVQDPLPPQKLPECPLCFISSSATYACLEKKYWKHPYFIACHRDGDVWLQTGKQSLNQYATITSDFHGLSKLYNVTICYWVREEIKHGSGVASVHYGEVYDKYCDDLSLVYMYDQKVGYQTLHLTIIQATVNTGQRTNDGHLHHVCFSWSSAYGNWHFYLDGVEMSRGSAFQKGYSIKTGGELSIGINKNRKFIGTTFTCDEFLSTEMFYGELAYLYFWNKILTKREINDLYLHCKIPHQDSLIAGWKMEKVHVKNNAKKIKYCI